MPYWRLFYHFVWGTKNGEPLIASAWESELHNVIAAKGAALGSFVHQVNGIENHVHLAVSVPPSIPLSHFMAWLRTH